MISTSYREENGRVVHMHHNGDYSGDVLFTIPVDRVELDQHPENPYYVVKIEFDTLKSLVAEYVTYAKTCVMEDQQSDPDRVLGVPEGFRN